MEIEVMDLRVQKTRRSIINAFLELRARKALEKITVKEPCERAEINKATFYLHFKDIYDLSDFLENEIAQKAAASIASDVPLTTSEIVKRMCPSYVDQKSLIDIVFSGKQAGDFVRCVEKSTTEAMYGIHPEWRGDLAWSTRLSFSIHGAFNAYLQNAPADAGAVLDLVAEMCDTITNVPLDPSRASVPLEPSREIV